MNRLLIIGAGELGRQVLHFAQLQGKYTIVGFVDDTKTMGTMIDECPVLGGISDIERLYTANIFDYAFIAIGYNHFNFKERLYNRLKSGDGIPLATIIAPMVWVDPTAKIGEGCILYPGTIVDKEVTISDNVVVNIGAKICHNSCVGLHCYISPSATIAGFCSIGSRCMVGMNSAIRDNTQICDDVVIGASATITKSITQPGTYININQLLKGKG